MPGNKRDSRLDTRNVLRHNYVRPTNHKRLHIIYTLSSFDLTHMEYRYCKIIQYCIGDATLEKTAVIFLPESNFIYLQVLPVSNFSLNPSTEIIGSLSSFNFSTPGNFSFPCMFEMFNPIKKAVLTWKTSANVSQKIFLVFFLVVVQSRHRLLKSSSLYFFSSLWSRLKRTIPIHPKNYSKLFLVVA